MTDYGHDIQFGAFISPGNNPPHRAVHLAQLAERLGFDLVSFQDHPYQPAFHDTSTLMTWVAAQTERIHISADVLMLPLRPPAVVARSAASLDLLSGGRYELAVGAGGLWDPIHAMGGPRLSPGQAVDALEEAMMVIRGIWDVGNRTPLRIDGKYYRLDGAKRGPAPAHDIPIWVGASKPRMQRLIGRLADGWLPSLMWLGPGDLTRGNAIIDDSATEAGRDPRKIRRLVNIGGQFSDTRTGTLKGPTQVWVDDLLALAIEDGVSSFILMSDDPATMQRFAEEVIPALREQVRVERASSGTGGSGTGKAIRVRSTVALAARRDGIDYDALPSSLTGGAIEPGDAKFARVRNTYMRGGSPGLVLQVTTPEEVAEAIGFARAQDVPLAIRSRGHGISGRSTNDGGIVISLSEMKQIEVLNAATRRIRIGAGASWAEVAVALQPHGWALTSGDVGGVGVGGLATAGGIGWFAREHGLTIDHLRRVHVVLADGAQIDASDELNADLFWAMRGAGANFGIATSFEFEADEVGDVGFAQFTFQIDDTAEFLHAWGQAIESAPRIVTGQVVMMGGRPGQPPMALAMIVVDSADEDTIIAALEPIAATARLAEQSVQLMPYSAVVSMMPDGEQNGQGEPWVRSALIEHLSPEFASGAARLLDRGLSHFFQIRAVGGAVADVPPEATAYANRSANFSIAAFGRPGALDKAWDELAPHFSGSYLSFETDTRPERLSEAFPRATLDRLRTLKSHYDPDNLFRDNFNLTPRGSLVAKPHSRPSRGRLGVVHCDDNQAAEKQSGSSQLRV